MANEQFSDEFFESAFSHEVQPTAHQVHPSFKTLFAFVSKELDDSERSNVSVHIVTCSHCQERLADIEQDFQEITADISYIVPAPEKSRHSATKALPSIKSLMRSIKAGFSRAGLHSLFAPRMALVVTAAAVLIITIAGPGLLFIQVSRLEGQLAGIRSLDAQQLQAAIEELRLTVSNVSPGNAEEIARLESAIQEFEQSLAAAEQATAASIEDLKESIIASSGTGIALEGASDYSRIEVVALRDLSGYISIFDRINPKVLFEGILREGSTIAYPGQSLMISWHQNDGADALKITGWDHILLGKDGWKAVSASREIQDQPLVCSELFVVYFPEIEGGGCP